jgi:hypothetical protein
MFAITGGRKQNEAVLLHVHIDRFVSSCHLMIVSNASASNPPNTFDTAMNRL